MLLEISNSLQCVCTLRAVSVMEVLGLVANISKSHLALTSVPGVLTPDLERLP